MADCLNPRNTSQNPISRAAPTKTLVLNIIEVMVRDDGNFAFASRIVDHRPTLGSNSITGWDR